MSDAGARLFNDLSQPFDFWQKVFIDAIDQSLPTLFFLPQYGWELHLPQGRGVPTTGVVGRSTPLHDHSIRLHRPIRELPGTITHNTSNDVSTHVTCQPDHAQNQVRSAGSGDK